MDNYEIFEKLGKGTQGAVYRARQKGLDRDVAIKFFQDDEGDPVGLERFLREARLLAKIDHPNVVRVHDTGSDSSGRPYIVMEILAGQPLSDRIRQGALPPKEAAEIAAQILDGLSEVHRLGIVHRDIKPSNIRIAANGRPKLLDFGIARDSGMSTVTHKGKTVGTPSYMSPEQAQGLPIAAPADVYSVGIVLYEMLTGYVPFRADTPIAILRMHIDVAPPNLPPGIPSALDSIVRKALEKNPAKRFRSAEEMRAALQRFVDGTGVKVEKRAPSGAVPWKLAAAIGTFAAVGVLLLGALMGWFAAPIEVRKTSVEEPIPFRTVQRQSSDLAKGRSRIARRGQNGKKVLQYEVSTQGGSEVGRKPIGEPQTVPAVDEVKEIGTSPWIFCFRNHRNTWDAEFCGECAAQLPPITER